MLIANIMLLSLLVGVFARGVSIAIHSIFGQQNKNDKL